MKRTKLYAVERHMPLGDSYQTRYMVYGGIDNPHGVTWTTNISKASRWQNKFDAQRTRDEVVGSYKIRDAIIIREV